MMLPRVLEPEAMDTAEEARDYDGMDHWEVNARFVVDFLRAHGPCRGGEILDVGTGTARIPIALCQADAQARVVGLDLAAHMLARAKENIAAAGLTDRIRLAHGDAKAVRRPAGHFEAVISNSIVHHIPEPAAAVEEMLRLVAPGGTVLVRDLYRPADLATLDGLVQAYAGSEAAAARALFAASLHAALTLEEAGVLVQTLGVRAESVAMTSDRHWTWVWNRPG
jgi:ubiquinone/menaquinone biosynthesis C-methylase UbiE